MPILLCYGIAFWFSIRNVVGLFKPDVERKKLFWELTVIIGMLFHVFFYQLVQFIFVKDAHWTVQLYNSQVHQLACTEYRNVYGWILFTGFCGFLLLLRSHPGEMPPLITVLAMAALYPAMAACLVFCAQVMPGFGISIDQGEIGFTWMILPLNLVVIACSLIREKILEYQKYMELKEPDEQQKWYQRVLSKSKYWPLFALVFSLPILGIVLGISILRGQQPDAIIKTWTETADWNLSTRVGPPNIIAPSDGHYLCTVAAGGHKRVVKPLRMGERRGQRVVVNRQLEIANAFEIVLEEKTPRLHKAVRNFYDHYGFPIAKMIRTEGACDVVYVLMKPLEWIFLIVLYLTQPNPEDLIAIQYMPGYREFWQDFKKKKAMN